MYRTVQMVLGGFFILLVGLSALTRRFPDVAWLQVFRYNAPRLSEEQRDRMRCRANTLAGIEMILAGIIVPIAYFALTVMMFNDLSTVGTIVVFGSSFVLIGLGIRAIVRSHRR